MQTVDYHAIVHNARYFKAHLGASKLCAVLKNNAYGHGLVRTASCLCDIADCFAVGSCQEAMALRPFGRDVLILLPLFQRDLSAAVNGGFCLTLDSFETLDRLLAMAAGKGVRTHVKIQSGMNRLGFDLADLPLLAERISGTNIIVEGAFSHFWGGDKSSFDKQLEIFQKGAHWLSGALKTPLVCHIANTSALLCDPKYSLDMARVGLGLYGYGAPSLLPAKKVFARVVATRRVHAGDVVGYGGTYVAQCDQNIAVLDAGYANGFPRALKNAKVKIGNKLFPVIGNVCMAMLMVGLGQDTVAVGEEAVLLGDGVNNANCDVIVYELLCNLR